MSASVSVCNMDFSAHRQHASMLKRSGCACAATLKPQKNHKFFAAEENVYANKRTLNSKLISTLIMKTQSIPCWSTSDPLHAAYHDKEWGVPQHDDTRLFEFLVLGGFQAGLTWHMILKKREDFREAFDGFNPQAVAAYTDDDVERLMADPRLIRNRRKIQAAINNAQAFLRIQDEFGSFDRYVWRFVDGRPKNNNYKHYQDAPAESPESQALSRDLQERGFQFVGPTIIYAFMQAVGMVNDHGTTCHRHKQIREIQNAKAKTAGIRLLHILGRYFALRAATFFISY